MLYFLIQFTLLNLHSVVGTHAAPALELVCDKLIVGAVRSEQRASVFEILAFGITLQRLLDRFEIPFGQEDVR